MATCTNPKAQLLIDELLALDLAGKEEVNCIEMVKPIVQKWAQRDDWLLPEYFHLDEGSREKNHLLYIGDDGHLFVDVITWNRSEFSPIHDHKTWAVLGCINGIERSQYWKRLDDGSTPGYAKIEMVSEKVCHPGEVVAMTGKGLHCVCNCSHATEPTISLHVYGFDLTKTGRQKYDPLTDTVEPMETLLA